MKKNARKKRKGDFPYESSLGEIRLKTSPSIRARHALSNTFLDIVGKAHKFNEQCFIRLIRIEAINLFW